MPKGPESKIEKKLREYMESKGGMFPKAVSPGNAGWPDRNPCHPVSGPFYMELKAPGKHSEEHQMLKSKEMAGFGYRVYASVNSLRKGIEIIDDEINGVRPLDRRHKPVSA